VYEKLMQQKSVLPTRQYHSSIVSIASSLQLRGLYPGMENTRKNPNLKGKEALEHNLYLDAEAGYN